MLVLLALLSLAGGDRIIGGAMASSPVTLPDLHKQPASHHGNKDKDHEGKGKGDDVAVSVPLRTQSAQPPTPVATPAPSAPAPVASAPAPARLTEDRSARKPQPSRTIRMRKGGGAGRSDRLAGPAPAAADAGSVQGANAGKNAQGSPDRALRLVAAKGAAVQEPSRKTSERQPRDTDPKPEQESEGSPVVRTVKDIVEVVPKPVKMALAALTGVSALLACGYLFVAGRARRLDRQRADLLQEVGLLQTALLPPVPGTVGAVRTSVAYRPSDGPGAGGDFYDALTLPGGRAAFILGDVSGHGRQALARTAFARFTLRAYLEAGLEPRTALQVAGRVIDQHLDGHFATVVIAVHDPSDGSLTYACAGHPAPIVVGPTRPEPILAASSPPIGLELRTGVRQTTLPLPPGSVVCLYTDGLAESRTEDGILGRPRLADIVAEQGRGATAAGLLKAVAGEARLVTDDMATVLISPTAGVTSGGFRSEQLEVDAEDADSGLAERFLEACEVRTARLREAASEARALAHSHGGAVLHVRFGPRGAQVEVLPRNVESLEAASQRSAAAAG